MACSVGLLRGSYNGAPSHSHAGFYTITILLKPLSFLPTFYVPRVTNIDFLPTISIHNQEKRFWELVKWSSKKKMLQFFIKFSQVTLQGNVWRSGWRICKWYWGWKGEKHSMIFLSENLVSMTLGWHPHKILLFCKNLVSRSLRLTSGSRHSLSEYTVGGWSVVVVHHTFWYIFWLCCSNTTWKSLMWGVHWTVKLPFSFWIWMKNSTPGKFMCIWHEQG